MRYALGGKKGALFRAAGGSENLGARLLRQPYGSQADAAGRRVDQHSLTACQPRHVSQPVDRGQKRDRNGRSLLRCELWGARHHERMRRVDVGAEAARCQGHDLVAHGPVRHTGTNGANRSRTLITQRAGLSGIQTERIEHIAEVEPCGSDADGHLAGAGQRYGGGLQSQAVQYTRLRLLETDGLIHGERSVCPLFVFEARHVAPAGAPGDAIFAAIGLHLGH